MKKKPKIPEKTIIICIGSECRHKGNKELIDNIKKTIKEQHLKDVCSIVKTHCMGRCKFAPIVSVQPDNLWLYDISQKEIKIKVEKAILSPNTDSLL
ncbi:MAG: (2Fe-2S) ferredoxin domain-containing protein [Bacteroidetes bacterium]|nr:MAG: (2Fe-2S) ferredoxin domain-containing protein [Bacteroidota bacterium]TAG87760.1 MAG: (2Fe-2S) ferredoxin domain-containing protein [Bacteroidota bacterium]